MLASTFIGSGSATLRSFRVKQSRCSVDHREIDATCVRRLDGKIVPRVRVAHHARAGVRSEHTLKSAVGLWSSVSYRDHSGMNRIPDAHTSAMMNRNPARAA